MQLLTLHHGGGVAAGEFIAVTVNGCRVVCMLGKVHVITSPVEWAEGQEIGNSGVATGGTGGTCPQPQTDQVTGFVHIQ